MTSTCLGVIFGLVIGAVVELILSFGLSLVVFDTLDLNIDLWRSCDGTTEKLDSWVFFRTRVTEWKREQIMLWQR